MDNLELLIMAEKSGHEVFYGDLRGCRSMSVEDGGCYIGIDMHTTQAEEKVLLAHELGHCEYAGFYNRYTPLVTRKQIENRVRQWAYKKLVPPEEIQAAINGGAADTWELAEHFGVTYEFMCDAMSYYEERCGIVFEAPEI